MSKHGAGAHEKRCALIQAVVTPTVAGWVIARARAEDRTVSDYLRRLVEAEMRASGAEPGRTMAEDEAPKCASRQG